MGTFQDVAQLEGENAAVAVIYFNDSESNTFVNYLFMDVYAKDAADEYDISSKRIGKLTTRDTETAVANGKDDSAGVDALPSDSDNCKRLSKPPEREAFFSPPTC